MTGGAWELRYVYLCKLNMYGNAVTIYKSAIDLPQI